jgi:hypothetical protein
MRKIIGFRLAPRVKELQRRARKANLSLAGAGLDEVALEALLERAVKAANPAVLFDTFSQPDADHALLASIPGLAYSLVLASLGEGFEAFRQKAAQEEPATAELWPVAQELLLDEAARFATALLEDEAAKESCELSPFTPLSEPAAVEAALKKLDGAKISVCLSEGRLSPPATIALSLSWLSKSRSKGKGKG